MEIIQIGYAVFDYRFNILEKKSIIIKPEFFPKISTFIKSLTGISQERVDSGVLFPQGYKEFLNIAKHAKYVISWGSYDHLQLREELKRRNMLENPDFFNKLVNGNELVSEALGKRRK